MITLIRRILRKPSPPPLASEAGTHLAHELRSLRSRVGELTSENQQLRVQVEGLEATAAELRRVNSEIRRSAEKLGKENAHLKRKILAGSLVDESQEFFNETAPTTEHRCLRPNNNADQAQNEVLIPESLDELAEWVETNFGDQLVLTGRALNAAKKSEYHDPKRIYQALTLIGRDYWNVVFNRLPAFRERFKQASQETGLRISHTSKGKLPTARADRYIIDWNGSKRILDRHLQHGNSRDPRYCLRVYFFVDEPSRKIVIGHLPDHLPNSVT